MRNGNHPSIAENLAQVHSMPFCFFLSNGVAPCLSFVLEGYWCRKSRSVRIIGACDMTDIFF
ncbi:hypothetical protein BJY04DRAFT_192613 [Aspergillus karnatakaensis]|uniref:uncharacterized protein n=1 Tax=Aspergillus karnatakaensis TaxID=1810916 RepID=UPI003CCD53F7